MCLVVVWHFGLGSQQLLSHCIGHGAARRGGCKVDGCVAASASRHRSPRTVRHSCLRTTAPCGYVLKVRHRVTAEKLPPTTAAAPQVLNVPWRRTLTFVLVQQGPGCGGCGTYQVSRLSHVGHGVTLVWQPNSKISARLKIARVLVVEGPTCGDVASPVVWALAC